ncbi:MAG: hypothetical protein ACRDUA_16745 [Micromonosporaceae bacterium]
MTYDPVNRSIQSGQLAADPSSLDAYPHRYVHVVATSTPKLATLFWCVEMLETRGWEDVTWVFHGGQYPHGVVMRRTRPPGLAVPPPAGTAG